MNKNLIPLLSTIIFAFFFSANTYAEETAEDLAKKTQNLFRLGRHLMQAVNYRILRSRAFSVWQDVVCA